MASRRRQARRDHKWNRYLDRIAGRNIITFEDAKRIGIKIPPGYNEGPRRGRPYIGRRPDLSA